MNLISSANCVQALVYQYLVPILIAVSVFSDSITFLLRIIFILFNLLILLYLSGLLEKQEGGVL